MFDWNRSCSYDEQQKRRFHTTARLSLKRLAAELALPSGSFDLRSNRAGIAVSGEITLHHDRAYIQVGQFGLSSGHGILIRTCKGRKDYTGGPNRDLAWRNRGGRCLGRASLRLQSLQPLLGLPACRIPIGPVGIEEILPKILGLRVARRGSVGDLRGAAKRRQ